MMVKPLKKWKTTERELYLGYPLRVMGEVDVNRAMLVEFLDGPLKNERRWFTEQELQREDNDERSGGVSTGTGGGGEPD